MFKYLRVELLDHRELMFNFVRNTQTLFQSGHSILHSC